MLPRTWLAIAAVAPSVLADGGGDEAAEAAASLLNDKTIKYTAITWAAIIFCLLVYRWTLNLIQHVRQLANLNHGTSSDGRQRYFSIPDENWSKIKRYLIVAPLFNRRHNREFRLSAAINVGTLPGRMQTFWLLGYFALNITFTVWGIDWSNGEAFRSQGLGRTGVLSVLNMIPLFLLAGRNNPLIWLLGISFDNYNMIHR